MNGPRSRPRNLFWLGSLSLGIFLVSPALLLSVVKADDVVLTKNGVPLKIVVRVDSAIYASPDKTSNSSPVKPFEYYYVLPPEQQTDPLKVDPDKPDEALKNNFFKIATSTKAGSMVGWISKDDVVVWPHRQALGLKPISGRKPALFYKSKDDLTAAYLGGSAPPPMSKEPEGGAGLSLMPLLATYSLKNPSGDQITGYRVGYLHQLANGSSGGGGGNNSSGSGAGNTGGQGVARGTSKSSTLDVVFVIDTTASMEPCIEATKALVRTLAQKLATDPNQSVPVRLGLVAYRDRIPDEVAGWYVTKVFWDLNQTAEITADSPGKGTNLTAFLEVLETVKAATVGSDGFPEDILGGLREAIKLPSWNPNAFKHIVLIGDASGHVESSDPKNVEKLSIEGIKAMMQPPGKENVNAKIICSAIRFESAEDPGDGPLADQHFTKLAEGVNYPGFVKSLKKEESEKFVDEMVKFFNTSRAGMRELINDPGMAKAQPGGAVPAGLANVTGIGLLLEMVAAGAPGEGTTPSFASGFTANMDIDGHEQVEPYLLVQFGQLDTFRVTLNFTVKAVQGAGDPGKKEVKQIVDLIQQACSSLNMSEPIQPGMPLEVYLSYILGFPVKSDIFKVTPQVLAQMTQEDFDQWAKGVEACDSIIRGYLESPKLWKSLGRSIKPDERQGFIRISELP